MTYEVLEGETFRISDGSTDLLIGAVKGQVLPVKSSNDEFTCVEEVAEEDYSIIGRMYQCPIGDITFGDHGTALVEGPLRFETDFEPRDDNTLSIMLDNKKSHRLY
ncbi:hypothetical protein [Sulfitobacter dubius]|uniref:Uncharacterized protein n=1 Tax=Sulfitobacter dubius TaxID=218673 RepID=A0ABY3ZPK3_9RHOB|nr:hypothetical protein [Sulfitobacter dubius]UOA16546.1 hypothetical protein DSM109990_03430 [Sulfitobacter dubius]